MKRLLSKLLSLSLIASIALSVFSCAKKESSNNDKKVSANSPWFNSTTYNIDLGTDPDREIEGNDYDLRFVGVDEKYLVVYATGQYEGTMDDKNANWRKYAFGIVSIIDRNTKAVVNKIDVKSSLDELEDESVINVTYSNGRITVKTSLKETDYDPSIVEVLDSRPVSKNGLYPLPDHYFNVGEYVIEARWDDGNGNGSFSLKITAPDGGVSSAEIKENGTNINNIKMLPLSDTKALFITHSSKGYLYFELDLTNNKVSEADSQEYEWINLNKLQTSIISTDGKIYCRIENGILNVDAGSKNTNEVFNYNWCGTNTTKLKRFILADYSADTFLFFGKTNMNRGVMTGPQRSFQIIELTKADKNPNAGKTILDLYSPYLSEDICAAIEKYNETNEKCFIEISERYSDKEYDALGGDWRNYSSMDLKIHTLNANSALGNDLIADIVAGKGPDILIGMSRYSQFNNPDYLVDLSTYVNNLDSEKYFTNIIEGSKTNGAIYQLPVSFFISGIYTDKDNAGASGVGFTFEEYRKFVSETLNGNDVITAGQALYFTELFNSMDDRFIKDGKVDFTGSEFAEIADYVKENVPENGRSRFSVVEGTQDKAFYDEYQSYFHFYQQKSNMRELENPSILGIPSVDGRGPMFNSSCAVAVSAHSTDIDACGEFVKLLLSDEIQTGIAMSGMGFVLNRNAFRSAGDGAVKFCNNRDDDFSSNKIKFTINDINNLENIILSCSNMINEDMEINVILIEEMPAYFLGQKDLDSVTVVAQDRSQKVLDERG